MAYPQPSAEKYVVSGYEFFRLNTPLLSDGDIYQSEAGAKAFAIGPESDIATVNLAYYDTQAQGFMNQIAITPQRPFAGRLDANLMQQYTPSNRPGKILMWPGELFNSNITPPGWVEANDRLDIVSPRLDVIQFFSPPAALPGLRNDKTFFTQNVPWPTAKYNLAIPYFGRRYANVTLMNVSGVGFTFNLFGLTFLYGTDSVLTTIDGGVTVAFGGTPYRKVVKATTDGMFDMLLLQFDPDSAPSSTQTLIRVVVSDTEV